MDEPETVKGFAEQTEEQAKVTNDAYLRGQQVSDEFVLGYAKELAGADTPASLPLFFEYLREGRSKEQVVSHLLQFYCEEVTKEHNAAAAFRFYRAPKRPDPGASQSRSKRRKKR